MKEKKEKRKTKRGDEEEAVWSRQKISKRSDVAEERKGKKEGKRKAACFGREGKREEKRKKRKCVGMKRRKRWREMKGESVEDD